MERYVQRVWSTCFALGVGRSVEVYFAGGRRGREEGRREKVEGEGRREKGEGM